MRKVREAALSRLQAPDFLPLIHHELVQLRQVPAWVRWLYVELLAAANLKTGAGKTSWARVMAVLDFDQAPTGRARAGGVTLKQARDAVDELQSMGLVARDKGRNEAQGFLFFHVKPRRGFAAPAGESGRGSGRGSTARKASKDAASSVTTVGVPAGVRAGGSGVNSYPLPPSIESCPQPTVRPAAEVVAELKAARRTGGRTRAPEGA